MSNSLKMHKARIWLISVSLALSFASVLAAKADEPAGWKKIDEGEGLTIFQKDVAGTSVVAFRGEGEVEAAIDKVAAVLLDDDRAGEWVERMEILKTVKMTTAFDYLEYSKVNMPPLIQDRDFLTHVTLEVDKATRTFSVRSKSVEDPVMPVGKAVRGQIHQTLFALTPVAGSPGRTRVVAELHVDPQGSIPKWIVNLFQRAWPKKVFGALRKQLTKTDIAMPARFAPVTGAVNALVK